MKINEIFDSEKRSKFGRALPALATIIIAILLIELISLVQYRYTHRLMENELDYRTESELTLKSVRVRGLLKSSEKMVRNYLWPIQRQIKHPDKIYDIIKRIVVTNHDVMSSFVTFKPGYYPDREYLFEPCATRLGDSIMTLQMASEKHDYTQREFYHNAVDSGLSSWSDPYPDEDASGVVVTTYAVPLKDDAGQTVGAFGIDLSVQGIIDTLNTKHNYPSTFFLLLTEDGKLISQPDTTHSQHDDVAMVVSMINDSTCERESSASGLTKIITFNDKEKGKGYAYYAFMKGRPHWQVVMVCYDDEVYGKLNKMRRIMLLMSLAALSLLGFILYRFNRNVSRLHESKLNKERADSELRVAQNIQAEMLPSEDINRPDVEVSGKQVTALEVGGDLYDYFIRDEKLYFCIGDVSGKGVPSSLVMAVVHSFFRSQSMHESNPAHIMQVINEIACEGNKTNMFVTLFIGVLDLPTGRLRYCNAGHDAPLLITSGVKLLPVNANLPAGLFDDFKYVQQQASLEDGTTLFLYTDGLTEMADPDRRMFGLQRIIDTAQDCLKQGKIAHAVLMNTVYEESKRFANGAQQSDDLTMLTINYHRPEEEFVLDEQLKTINDVHQVPEVNKFVTSVGQRLNLEPSLVSQLMLAVEEAVVNVMNYAYPIGTQGDITIEAKATGQWLKFIISDEGKAFDPTQGGNADTSLSAEDRPIGGLGILLVRSLMDSINYEYNGSKNVLTLMKALGDKK